MNNTQVYQAQTTNHGIARALGEEIRMITDVEETNYNGHGEIIVEYTSDVALTKLFDRIKSLYEKAKATKQNHSYILKYWKMIWNQNQEFLLLKRLWIFLGI